MQRTLTVEETLEPENQADADKMTAAWSCAHCKAAGICLPEVAHCKKCGRVIAKSDRVLERVHGQIVH